MPAMECRADSDPCGSIELPLVNPVPWEEFVEPRLRRLGDPAEDIGEPGLRIDVVEIGGVDQVYIAAARTPLRSDCIFRRLNWAAHRSGKCRDNPACTSPIVLCVTLRKQMGIIYVSAQAII